MDRGQAARAATAPWGAGQGSAGGSAGAATARGGPEDGARPRTTDERFEVRELNGRDAAYLALLELAVSDDAWEEEEETRVYEPPRAAGSETPSPAPASHVQPIEQMVEELVAVTIEDDWDDGEATSRFSRAHHHVSRRGATPPVAPPQPWNRPMLRPAPTVPPRPTPRPGRPALYALGGRPQAARRAPPPLPVAGPGAAPARPAPPPVPPPRPSLLTNWAKLWR